MDKSTITKLVAPPPRESKKRGYLTDDEIWANLNEVFGTEGWESEILSYTPYGENWVAVVQIRFCGSQYNQYNMTSHSHIGVAPTVTEAVAEAFRNTAKTLGRKMGLGLAGHERRDTTDIRAKWKAV